MTTPVELPGNPGIVSDSAASYRGTASAIEDAATRIRSLASESATAKSEAVRALSENAGDLADRLEKLHERYAVAGSALTVYADALATVKERSRANAIRYNDALAAQRHAEERIAHYVAMQRSLHDAEQMEYAAERVTFWIKERNDARVDVQEAINRHNQIEHDRDGAADAAKDQIKDVIDSDGLNDSWWDNVKGWVAENAEFLKTLKDALGWIATGLSLLSFVFPVLAPFALAAAALTAGLSLLLAASGEISWLEFGLDALALVTAGVGAAAGKTVSQAVKGLKGLRIARVTAQGGTKSAVRVVTGSFNSVCVGSMRSVAPRTLTKWMQVALYQGKENASAFRMLTMTRAGAGPLDAFFIDAGTQALVTIRNVGLAELAIDGIDELLGSDSGLPWGLDQVQESYSGLVETTTVELGSSW